MPTISIEEIISILVGIIILFAGGFLSRAGQDAWTAIKRSVRRSRRREARKRHPARWLH